MKKSIVALCFSVIAGLGFTQTTVIHPYIFKTKVAPSSFAFLFRSFSNSSYREARVMQVHDLNLSPALNIKSIAFRMYYYYYYNQYYGYNSFQVKVELRVSTAKTNSMGIRNTFAANHGTDITTVIAVKNINFPSYPHFYGFPKPFFFAFPFDSGKTFNLAPGKSLCWDMTVYDNTLYDVGNKSVDLAKVFPAASFYGTYYGQGCKAAHHPYYDFANYMHLGKHSSRWIVYGGCNYGPPHGRAFAFFSTGASTAGGIYLPILQPGCKIWINPIPPSMFLVKGPYKLNYYGYQYQNLLSPYFSIPINPVLYGAQFYSQFLAIDKSFKFYSTNGKFFQLPLWTSTAGVNLGVGYVYTYGPGAANAISGYASTNQGLVTRFN